MKTLVKVYISRREPLTEILLVHVRYIILSKRSRLYISSGLITSSKPQCMFAVWLNI